MGFSSPKTCLFLLLTLSILAISMANKNWQFGFNNTNYWGPKNFSNPNHGPNKIVVGGSDHWHFGFNYTDWALKHGPFYLNDVLVFKYDAPNATTFPHSVYLLPNLRAYLGCDLKRAKMVANWTHGGGDGFEFVLKRWQPYYFACGERSGFHCKTGLMKFIAMPMPRWWR